LIRCNESVLEGRARTTLKEEIMPKTGWMLALLAAGAVFMAGCASSGPPAAVNERGEHVYIDDHTLEALDRDLQKLAYAIRMGDTRAENAQRARLSQNARLYQKALLSAVYDDSSTSRRALAGIMLGFTGDSAVIPVLLEKANSQREAESVRLNSTLGLSAMGDRLRDYTDQSFLREVLVANMQDNTSSFTLRRASVDAYAVAFDRQHGFTIDPLLRRMITDPEPRVQVAAINAMGAIGDPVVVDDLENSGLGSPVVEIRVASAIALGRIEGSARVISALEQACRDSNVLVRRHSIDAVSRHYEQDADRVYQIVLTGLADFDDRVREAAAIALARINDERGIEPLLQATGDRTAVVRQAAASSVGRLLPTDREKEAFPLVELLTDQNPDVVNAAISSLSTITSSDYGSNQTQWRRYFYGKYPELDPARRYEGQPRPRVSSGIGQRRATQTTARPNPRQNWARQQQQRRPQQQRNVRRR
jgi:HEAT repeat protein